MSSGLFIFHGVARSLSRGVLGEVALAARRGVPMDQAFAGCAIEQLDGAKTLRIRCILGASLLDGGAELRPLCAVPDSSRAGLPHVLFR